MSTDKPKSDGAFKSTHLASHISHSETDVGRGTRPSGGRGSEVPEKFGKYRLIRLLGEGGMGAVYLARDSELGRDVALKLPKIKGAKSGEVLDRFRREARTAATLNHPNVCPMYEFGELEGQFFLTMAYVDGQPLSYYTKKTKAIAARQAALLIRKLAMALAHAHEKGIIHRDLKPGNVMINKKAEPIVMDFGLARRDASEDTRLTQTGAFVGTPAYVSPEQITNRKGEVDHRTDIYSLGVMLYEMLAQRLPYEAENAMNMMAQVLTGTPDSPTVHRERACPRLSEIAMKAITRDVTQRYQTMKEVADDLTAYLKGDTAPRADLSESAARTAAASGDEVYQTAALDAENIDFLNFDLKDYGLGETVSPRSKTVTGKRDSKTSVRSSQTRSASTASAGSSARRSRLSTAQRRSDNSGNKSLLLGLGGFAIVVAIALGIFLTIRTKYGSVVLEITGNPDDVQISVDGETISLEVLERGYTIEVGPHAMTVKADGFVTETKEFTVSNGEEEIVTVKLSPSPPTPGTGSSRSPVAASTSDPGFDALLGKGRWKWSDPEPVMSGFDNCHTFTVSSDACTLIVSSWRPGGVGDKDLWISQRASTLEPWPELKNMGATINRKSADWSPCLSSDGTELYFHSANGTNGGDIFVSKWDPGTDAWTEAAPVPSPVNSPGAEQSPLLSVNGLEMVLWARRDGHGDCLWQYRRQDLSSPFQSEKSLADALPPLGGGIDAFSSDSFQILTHTSGGKNQFAISRRDDVDAPWKDPTEILGLPDYTLCVRYAHTAGMLFFQRWPSHDDKLWQMRLVDANDESIPFGPVTPKEPLKSDETATRMDAGSKTHEATDTGGWHGWPADAPPPAVAPFDAQQAQKHQEAWAEYLDVPVEYTNSIGMKFRLIPPGQFLMGTPQNEIDKLPNRPQHSKWAEHGMSEGPQHSVVLTRPIYFGVHEVTQSQFEQVVRKNPSHFSAGGKGKDAVLKVDSGNLPVETVTWNDSAEFCVRLSKAERLEPHYVSGTYTLEPADANGYRLPTEAQWEFACRAGTITQYWTGDDESDLLKVDWFAVNSNGMSQPVGQKDPNPFGLHDMHGNVWEWVDDIWESGFYTKISRLPAINPINPIGANTSRCIRGGGWYGPPGTGRAGARGTPNGPNSSLGFRIALPILAIIDSE